MTPYLIKLAVKIIYWVVVYYIFVPPARERNRSKIGWFIIGLVAGPVPIIACITTGNLLQVYKCNTTAAVIFIQNGALIGFIIGAISFLYFSRLIRKLPRIEKLANQSLKPSP